MSYYPARIPTYFGRLFANQVDNGEVEEFGEPTVSVLVHAYDGIRLILGPDGPGVLAAPDILVERHPHGWGIYLHPLGGSDPSACVYMLDDGRSVLVPEEDGPTKAIQVLEPYAHVPEIDGPITTA